MPADPVVRGRYFRFRPKTRRRSFIRWRSFDAVDEPFGSIRFEIGAVDEPFGSIRFEIDAVDEPFGSVRFEIDAVDDENGDAADPIDTCRFDADPVGPDRDESDAAVNETLDNDAADPVESDCFDTVHEPLDNDAADPIESDCFDTVHETVHKTDACTINRFGEFASVAEADFAAFRPAHDPPKRRFARESAGSPRSALGRFGPGRFQPA